MAEPRLISIQVRRSEKGLTLLVFIAAHLHLSKKKAKALLDRRHVFVNRQRVWIAHHCLAEGDLVEVLQPPERPASTGEPVILLEDRLFLVVDKPPGITATGPGSIELRLAQALDSPSLRAAHRLDRDTSGCLLLGKSAATLEYFERLFRERRVKKTYHAIVAGRVTKDSFTIRSPIDGEQAVTHVRTLDTSSEASHLLVFIETGRTHQIRRHLAARRHPVLGDRQYATSIPATERTVRIPRQMLHSYRLSFPHPATGELVVVTSPLPSDFRACLRRFSLDRAEGPKADSTRILRLKIGWYM